MNKTSDLRRLNAQIATLATTITDIIKAQVQATATAAATAAMTAAAQAKPPAGPPATTQAMPYDPVLTKRQLAAHFQVSARTIDNWCQRGYLPYYKVGKVVRFRLSDIKYEWDAKLKIRSRLSRW
jgi:excisionase family DNA binding protein